MDNQELNSLLKIGNSFLQDYYSSPRGVLGSDMPSGLSYIRENGIADRDIYSALGYNRNIRFKDFVDRYRRGDISNRLVHIFPDSCWTADSKILEDDNANITTPFEEQVDYLIEELDLWTALRISDILSCLGGESYMIIGATGDTRTPLKCSSIDDIKYFTPNDVTKVKVKTKVKDKLNPRFDQPEIYTIDGRDYHYTRVEYFNERPFLAKPLSILEIVWNKLDDLDRVVGGGAESSWRRGVPGLHINQKDPDTEIEDESNLKAQLKLYVHNLSRIIRTRGFDVNQLSASSDNFDTNAKAILGFIVGTFGIPQRIFFGSERGELASSQDRNNFKTIYGARRKVYCKPILRRLFNKLQDSGAMDKPEQWLVEWAEETDKDIEVKSRVTTLLTTAATRFLKETGTPLLLASEIRDLGLGRLPLTQKDIDKENKGFEEGVEESPEGDNNNDDGTRDSRHNEHSEHSRLSNEALEKPESVALAFESFFESVLQNSYESVTIEAETIEEIDTDQIVTDLRANLETHLLATHNMIYDFSGAQECVLAESRGSFFLEESRQSSRSSSLVSSLRHSVDLEKVDDDTFKGTVNGHNVDVIKVESGPDRNGTYWVLQVDGVKRSHFREFEGANRFLNVFISDVTVPQFAFDYTNDLSIQWSKFNSAKLVQEITQETEELLNSIVVDGVINNKTVDQVIGSLKGNIGLLRSQKNYIDNLRSQLLGAKPGTLVTRFPAREGVRDKPAFSVVVPEFDNIGDLNKWVGEQTEKYRLLNLEYRRSRIARSESIKVANAGTRGSWQQKIQQGWLIEEDIERYWITTFDGREREEHANRDGESTGVNEPYPGGTEPGEEVSCRCGQGLRRKKK